LFGCDSLAHRSHLPSIGTTFSPALRTTSNATTLCAKFAFSSRRASTQPSSSGTCLCQWQNITSSSDKIIPPSTGLPKADFWCKRLDKGAEINHPSSCSSGGGFGLDGDPSLDKPMGLVGLDRGLDFLPSAMLGA